MSCTKSFKVKHAEAGSDELQDMRLKAQAFHASLLERRSACAALKALASLLIADTSRRQAVKRMITDFTSEELQTC